MEREKRYNLSIENSPNQIAIIHLPKLFLTGQNSNPNIENITGQ